MPEWTLYGQTLDLEEFKKNHPGGDLAILLGEGRDCTRLFEQYHCRNASNQVVLKQLAAEQGKEIDPTIKDPFQQEILQMAYDYKGGYTASRPKLIFLSILTVFVTITWIGWAAGSWTACCLLPFVAWVWGVNIAHDAVHFASTNYQWLNKLLGLTASPLGYNSSTWYLSHIISHHTHTNEINRDFDLNFPFIRAHQERPSNSIEVCIGAFLTYAIPTVIQTCIIPFLVLFKDKEITSIVDSYDSIIKHCTLNIILNFIFTGLFISVPFFLFDWPKAIAFIFIPYILSGIIFTTITQVSHIQEEVQPETPNENWMRQMVESSMDYSQDSAFWSLITGGLNMQSLHHCLPAIDSSHLIELYPKFRTICDKHGVKIKEVPTLWDATVSFFKHINKLSKGPAPKPTPKGDGCPYKASKVA